MNKQISVSGQMDELLQARTKKKGFLEQMERLIPWGKWVEEIRPCYYKGERGNKPYQTYLDQMESYTYNAMGCPSTNKVIKGPFSAYNQRMRDEVGKKCQVVVFNHLADYEGVVSVTIHSTGNRKHFPVKTSTHYVTISKRTLENLSRLRSIILRPHYVSAGRPKLSWILAVKE